ncbi:hypothetical protein NDA10_006005 [Ustilago hordei]|uniref:Chromatin modification-related protein EAF6 n=1 Tax=Ustilago hordei TaxID=120017 RepID=I2FVK5_USTHO|nr:uncharacterized protein UHO2_04485 [Ustilago hordei]KAJ1042436.1 hypothetical protein NDA10_006005 [Ustilago hordei]KAJ1578049.1 hypothetical protein NDA12_002793 [Ustilago hordei]KAJ1592351.1 hypothetical protein NDA15_000346 [Ustilago hordei]CCF50948.1 uncharacterized protein UHOR_06850 [Ustilago hordei]SYW84546.1 uncharacterized protein UHO2_04485 [Ustilago hordei]
MAPTATGPTPSTTTAGTTTAGTTTTSATPATASTSSLEEANQRYQATKLSLRTGLATKRLIDRSLIDLESQIYLFEGSYLQSTSTSGGNIVKGFDSYLKNSSSGAGGGRSSSSNNVLLDIPLEDRIFSLSSATYQKSLELKANEGLEPEEPASSSNTPKANKSGGIGEEGMGTGGKKKKEKEKETAVGTPAGGKEGGAGGVVVGGTGKKKKDKDGMKEKERSQTPNLKLTSGGGKAGDGGGSASATPTKGTCGGGKAIGSTGTKLKRKITDVGAGASEKGGATPGGKAGKRKKDDD